MAKSQVTFNKIEKEKKTLKEKRRKAKKERSSKSRKRS